MELIQVKKKKSVIQDTLVMDFVLCHTTFLFEWVAGGGVLPHQRGTLSKYLTAKCLKE